MLMKNIVNRALVAKKKQFLSKSVPRGTRTIWRYLGALFLLFTFAIGNVWGADYTLNASSFASDKVSATVDDLTFTFSVAHGGAGSNSYAGGAGGSYLKYSKNSTITITLPDGFVASNINIKGYTNKDGYSTGAIQEFAGVTQTGKTFIARNDADAATNECITTGYDFAISSEATSIAFKLANTQQVCLLITITGTIAGSSDPVAVTGITIAPSPATVKIEKTAALTATVAPANATEKGVTWSVKSGSDYASVNATTGVVTGIAEGTAVITASAKDESGVTQDVTVNVVGAGPFDGLNYDGENALPEDYKYYGSSAGTEDNSGFTLVETDKSTEGYAIFLTNGGQGAYNKRAMMFTLTEDLSVDIKVFSTSNSKTFQIYEGNTVKASKECTAKNTVYDLHYDFTGATALSPKTYSFSGNGGNIHIAKITFSIPTKYTVTYDLNGGSGTIPTETDKAEGTKFNLHNGTTSITAPTDKEFSKWVDQDDNEYDGGAEFTMPGKNVTLTAKWVDAVTRYTVTYDLNGGEGDAPTETDKAAAEVFALAAAPTRAGHNFTGWLCDIDGAVKAAGTNYTMTAAPTTFTAQWEAYVACVSVVPATEGESPAAAGDPISVTGTGATFSMLNNQTTGKTGDIAYSTSGLLFANASGVGVVVTLDHLMKAGTVITATISADYKNDANRGLLLHNASGTKKADWVWKPATDALQEEKVFTYTVVADDGLAGNNVFRIVRSTNAWLKSLTVSNCGAELIYYGLTSAVVPSGKGTVTLSASSLLEGETATATYAISDENYEFDEWQISGTGATLSSTTANPTTITMGSTDAVVTLKLKEKAGFAVTYKANNGTEEADVVVSKENTFAANTFTVPDGKMFAGWNTQDDGEGTNYAVGDAVTEDITVYAKWVVDPTIRLILKSGDTYSINTDKFTVYEGTELQNEEYTVDGKTFAKNFKFGGNCSSTPFAGQAWSNKFMAYDVASNSTDIKLYVYNKNNSNKKLYYQIVPEGSAAAAFQSLTITSKATNQVVTIPTIAAAKGARVLFGVESADVRICQVEVLENGTALPAFGTNGYEFSVPGRAATYNKVGAFDGFEFKTNADLKFISGQDYIALRNIDGSQYVKFTVATNIQLQVTTPNANKFYVSKTAAGDAEKDTQYGGSAATHNVNLHAGTYYIAPTVGSSGGEVRITKLAFATAPAVKIVTFNVNGGSSVAAQEVFAGEKAVKPEDPTKDGYRFVEWQQSGSAYNFDEAVATDITLDAVWQKTWKVTFDADNGSDPVVVTVDNNQAVAQPVNPEKSGFDFVEWQLSGSVYNFATLVTDDIILKAKWEVAQDDATISALSYNGNAIDVASAEEVSGVQTYTYHLPWGSTIDPALVSVTKNAETATVGSITYDSENNRISFAVESGNHTVTINYAIQFVIDAKRGTSIVKATTNNVVTGLIGGTIDQSYSGNANSRKLNKTNYFGVTLANDETFQEGDVFIVNITTAADLGKFMVFADKDRTELIADQGIVYTKPDVASPVVCPTGEMMLVLPAAANGKKSLYLSRENVDNSEQWNVTFSYIEVTREMNPAIKSFKFGDDAATINESAKTISIDVPYGTAVTALTPTVEAYGNNGATYTPAGATDFTSPVVYTVTDAYNELHTDYTVTVNIAAPSTNAYLASLSVAGYALDFDKDVEDYNIVLDYGTTVLPAITYEVEDVGLAEAVKVEDGVNGATTITVTPQAGAGYEKVYTINFSVSTTPKFVIYDGSTMTTIAESGSDVSTGFAWTMVGGKTDGAKNINVTLNGKTYTTAQNVFGSPTSSTTRYIEITIPNDYVAKFYLAGATNNNGDLRSSYISKEKTGTLDKSIAYASADQYTGAAMRSDYQLPGTYYYCSDASIRLYELSVQLYPIDEARAMTQGRFGTICYPNGGRLLGAMLLEIAYFDPDQKKIFFDEVIGGQMVAGAPYLFLPNEGVDKFAIVYTDNVNALAGHHNGLYGSYTQEALPTDGNHYIMLNNQYCKVVEANTYVGANRAYIQLDKIGNDYVDPVYGRRRVSLGVQQAEVATGLEDLNVGDQPIKIMINGQMYILRGEKMYDATGRLVK